MKLSLLLSAVILTSAHNPAYSKEINRTIEEVCKNSDLILKLTHPSLPYGLTSCIVFENKKGVFYVQNADGVSNRIAKNNDTLISQLQKASGKNTLPSTLGGGELKGDIWYYTLPYMPKPSHAPKADFSVKTLSSNIRNGSISGPIPPIQGTPRMPIPNLNTLPELKVPNSVVPAHISAPVQAPAPVAITPAPTAPNPAPASSPARVITAVPTPPAIPASAVVPTPPASAPEYSKTQGKDDNRQLGHDYGTLEAMAIARAEDAQKNNQKNQQEKNAIFGILGIGLLSLGGITLGVFPKLRRGMSNVWKKIWLLMHRSSHQAREDKKTRLIDTRSKVSPRPHKIINKIPYFRRPPLYPLFPLVKQVNSGDEGRGDEERSRGSQSLPTTSSTQDEVIHSATHEGTLSDNQRLNPNKRGEIEMEDAIKMILERNMEDQIMAELQGRESAEEEIDGLIKLFASTGQSGSSAKLRIKAMLALLYGDKPDIFDTTIIDTLDSRFPEPTDSRGIENPGRGTNVIQLFQEGSTPSKKQG